MDALTYNYPSAGVTELATAELRRKLASRLAAFVSDCMRTGQWPASVCNLVFDRLADAFAEESEETLLSLLDDCLRLNATPG